MFVCLSLCQENLFKEVPMCNSSLISQSHDFCQLTKKKSVVRTALVRTCPNVGDVGAEILRARLSSSAGVSPCSDTPSVSKANRILSVSPQCLLWENVIYSPPPPPHPQTLTLTVVQQPKHLGHPKFASLVLPLSCEANIAYLSNEVGLLSSHPFSIP